MSIKGFINNKPQNEPFYGLKSNYIDAIIPVEI